MCNNNFGNGYGSCRGNGYSMTRWHHRDVCFCGKISVWYNGNYCNNNNANYPIPYMMIPAYQYANFGNGYGARNMCNDARYPMTCGGYYRGC